MKILWITNTLFPDICNELKIEVPVVGGWMFSSAIELLNTNPTIHLAVATPYMGDIQKTHIINGITYFLFPDSGAKRKYISELEPYWRNIQQQFQPELVHIHGTEYPHGLSYIRAFGNKNVVVSIQGLVSVIYRYYLGGIELKILRKNITLRDLYKQDTIFGQQKKLKLRGEFEKISIRSVNHVIGRTSWDKAHCWVISPETNYHYCNETLRNVFFQHTWELTSCERYSVFLSQAYYPIKGLQQMIKALPIILHHYPDTKVYVAGNNFVTDRGWRLNGFGKYICSLIKENNVTDKIIFTGVLSEKEMCKKYLNSHLFVCPSSIENSSNSIGEAQLLGVPCVASYVGGMADMVSHEETGLLYRYEEVEMLAFYVCRIFSDDKLAQKLSVNGRSAASLRHDKHQNAIKLNDIYETICQT